MCFIEHPVKKSACPAVGAIVLLVVAFALFYGCDQANTTNEESLRARVLKYWNHRVNKESDAAYDMEYSLFKKQIERSIYKKRFKKSPISYESPEIKQVTINPEDGTALVKIKIVAGVRGPGTRKVFKQPVTFTERWVLGSDKKWYHVPKGIKNVN